MTSVSSHRGAKATLSSDAAGTAGRTVDQFFLWPWERPRGRTGPLVPFYTLGLIPGAALLGFGFEQAARLSVAMAWGVPLLAIGTVCCCYVLLMLITWTQRPVVYSIEAEGSLGRARNRRQHLVPDRPID